MVRVWNKCTMYGEKSMNGAVQDYNFTLMLRGLGGPGSGGWCS